jgi:hypothetical protein
VVSPSAKLASYVFQVTEFEQRGSLANPDMERTEVKKVA